MVWPSRPQVGNRYGAGSALTMSAVFIRLRRTTRKQVPSWRRTADVHCERALRVRGPGTYLAIRGGGSTGLAPNVRDAEVGHTEFSSVF